ncbi:MAG: FecR family protein, partial [Moraxellaceae bacterium]|nr:FecR family protein [Moraxellaceae bacterium]
MRHFKPVLSGKGLLAASIAGLLSGHAVAETAGRVSYVTGDVTATGTDGSTRNLKRGDIISTGDKLRTNAGRLQIRLTDGGFVSLQPGTIFGVDEYLYANRKPEESSLFFSLLQGGMRTITGSIGKVNKQSYKVRTPVATIGIRGTGYRARIMRNGGLLVSVGSGFVNVGNRSGDTTAGSGQNIFVADENSKPGLTDEQADLGATGVNGDGDGENTAANEGQQENDGVTEGDLLNQFLANNPGVTPPGFEQVTPSAPTAMTVASPNLFLPRAVDGQTLDNGLVTATQDGVELFDAGTLKTVDKGSKGGFYWGAFTNGASAKNSLFGEGAVTLSATQYLPYIYSPDVVSNLYTTGTATYALTGKSDAYATSGQSTSRGTLNSLNLTVNFTSWLMDADLSVSIGSNTYTASGTGISPAGNSSDIFSLYLPNTTGGNCTGGSSGCSTNISGFFTNATSTEAAIGAAYNIYGTNDGHISGVAVLGHTGYTADPALPDPIPAFIASPGISSGATRIQGVFQNGALLSALSGTGNPPIPVFGAGTLHSTASDGQGSVYWGVFSNGESALNSLFDNYSTTVSLGTDQFLPYAYGSPLISSYQSGTAVYSLQTGSLAYGYNGSVASTGVLNHFNLSINFSDWTLAADLQVTMAGGNVYNAFGSDLMAGPTPGGNVFNATLDTTGGSCSGSGASCSTTIGGFFSGELNNQIGVGYAISGASEGVIKGAAVLGKDGHGFSLPNSTDYNYTVLACNGSFCSQPRNVFAVFDQDSRTSGTFGTLLTALTDNEGFSVHFDIGTLTPSGVTTVGSLSWGEFSDGVPSVGNMLNLESGVGLGSTEFAPYIVGLSQTPSFTGGSATYSLQGGTAARSNNGGVGTLDYFNLTLN